MDYINILIEISNKQSDFIFLLGDIKNVLECIFMLFATFFIYVFIRNLIKHS